MWSLNLTDIVSLPEVLARYEQIVKRSPFMKQSALLSARRP